MSTHLTRWALLATGLGCGLVAGVCFGFSAFIMPGLDRLAPGQSIGAMNAINDIAVKPAFMIPFMGTALACAGLAGWALLAGGGRATPWIVAGAALYVVGMVGVTIAANVPLNDTLATVSSHTPDAGTRWSSFYGDWMAWNHIRSALALTAAGMFGVALRVL